jgi:hypothetical protein
LTLSPYFWGAGAAAGAGTIGTQFGGMPICGGTMGATAWSGA